MKSKTKVNKQTKRKTSSLIIQTILIGNKIQKWREIASIISGPRRKRVNKNLSEINDEAKENEIIVVPGKVLSQGEINKKIKIVALQFSEAAKEKLSNSKCDFSTILQEIKHNPEAKNIKILGRKEK